MRKFFLFFLIILTTLALPLRLPAESKGKPSPKYKIYHIDTAQSEFTVNTDTKGLFANVGKNLVIAIKEFSGQVKFSEESIESSSLQMKVVANSFVVINKTKPKDKRKIEENTQDKVLESKQFPEISFESTRVTGVKTESDYFVLKITGNLTLHGVTKEITINARVFLKDGKLIANGGLGVIQTDFNIKPLTLLGGAYTVKNEVDLTFDLVALP